MPSSERPGFDQLINQPEEKIDLMEAALALAADEYPDLDVGRYLSLLSIWARDISQALPQDASAETKLEHLNEYLYGELGFSGNADQYYDPRNSFMSEVIDRRKGIPISLSVLYLELGRRLGLELVGVSFPGHFLLKLAYGGGHVVIDAYNGGVSLSEEDLEARLEQVVGTSGLSVGMFLAGVSKKDILSRMLANLKNIYQAESQPEKQLTAINRMLQINPDLHTEYRDRGFLLHSLECHHAALGDFQHYLKLQPDAPDIDSVRDLVIELQREHARIN